MNNHTLQRKNRPRGAIAKERVTIPPMAGRWLFAWDTQRAENSKES
jgi:hypothetical protein